MPTYYGRTVSARAQGNIDAVRDSVGRSPKHQHHVGDVEAIWSIF